MIFDILKYIYIALSTGILVFILIEMFKGTDWRKQVSAAMVLIPLILRIFLIR